MSTFHEITFSAEHSASFVECDALSLLAETSSFAAQGHTNQIWCLLQWCDVSATVMPSSGQRTPQHTMQTTFYYAEVIGRAGRNFLVPQNESSTD